MIGNGFVNERSGGANVIIKEVFFLMTVYCQRKGKKLCPTPGQVVVFKTWVKMEHVIILLNNDSDESLLSRS